MIVLREEEKDEHKSVRYLFLYLSYNSTLLL